VSSGSEEGLGHRPCLRDQIGGNAMICDDGKAKSLERPAERGRKGDWIGGFVVERKRWDLRGCGSSRRIEHDRASVRVKQPDKPDSPARHP
jgi:hypothetical protein